jgi:hypothetical protein
MLRRSLRTIAAAGLLTGVVVAVVRVFRGGPAPAFDDQAARSPLPIPVPAPAPEPVAVEAMAPSAAPLEPVEPVVEPVAVRQPWLEPLGPACPPSHPVKAKLSSGIYHLPGMSNYARCVPDRCYINSAAAEEDGLRSAKR